MPIRANLEYSDVPIWLRICGGDPVYEDEYSRCPGAGKSKNSWRFVSDREELVFKSLYDAAEELGGTYTGLYSAYYHKNKALGKYKIYKEEL